MWWQEVRVIIISVWWWEVVSGRNSNNRFLISGPSTLKCSLFENLLTYHVRFWALFFMYVTTKKYTICYRWHILSHWDNRVPRIMPFNVKKKQFRRQILFLASFYEWRNKFLKVINLLKRVQHKESQGLYTYPSDAKLNFVTKLTFSMLLNTTFFQTLFTVLSI